MEKLPNNDPAPPPLANPMAGASLALGLVSVGLFWYFAAATGALRAWGSGDRDLFETPLFWLTSIPAIVLGHLALRKIGRIFQPVRGGNIAHLGLIMGYLITFVMPMAVALTPRSRILNKGKIMQAVYNCRQIITAMRLYSEENGGNLLDAEPAKPTNSNDAFRLMFIGGQADNEMIFGCPLSPYMPDGNIGNPPDFREALKPGENHWAMTSGLSDSAPGTYPLVFENTADSNWPPKWDTNAVGVAKPGRVWNGNKIIIGMNDSSVSIQALESGKEGLAGLKSLGPGSKVDLFSQNDPTKDGLKIGILNVAR